MLAETSQPFNIIVDVLQSSAFITSAIHTMCIYMVNADLQSPQIRTLLYTCDVALAWDNHLALQYQTEQDG